MSKTLSNRLQRSRLIAKLTHHTHAIDRLIVKPLSAQRPAVPVNLFPMDGFLTNAAR